MESTDDWLIIPILNNNIQTIDNLKSIEQSINNFLDLNEKPKTPNIILLEQIKPTNFYNNTK